MLALTVGGMVEVEAAGCKSSCCDTGRSISDVRVGRSGDPDRSERVSAAGAAGEVRGETGRWTLLSANSGLCRVTVCGSESR